MQYIKKSTFKVLFYLKKNAPKKNGKVAIMGRITIDGKQSQFSTKLEILPDKWDLKFGRMLGKADEALRINQRLEEMCTRLQSLYDELMKRDGFVTSERLKNNFLGLDTAQETLLGLYEKFNQEMFKMVEKGTRVLGTYKKYRIVYNHLTRFIPKQYNRKDIPLRTQHKVKFHKRLFLPKKICVEGQVSTHLRTSVRWYVPTYERYNVVTLEQYNI